MKKKKNNNYLRRILPFVCCGAAAITFSGCSLFGGAEPETVETDTVKVEETKASETETAETKETVTEQTETQTEETTDAGEEKVSKLTLIAAGDNLIHDTVYEKFEENDGEYDFTPMYTHIKDTVQAHDLAVINQETILVENDSEIGSYPDFGTPHEMGDALVDTGFDVVLSATNHTMDRGTDAIYGMADYWERKYPDVKLLGIHESKKDADTIDYVEKNGIKLAMFNYTYGLNGYELPEDEDYLVDLLDDKEKFISDIKKAEDEADMTVCFLHIGDEYEYEPTQFQVDYVNDVIDAGADVVICSHPHVVEPFGEIITDKGNKGVVFYSCGNFVSGQDEIDRLLGGMAEVEITKTSRGDKSETKVTGYDFIPVVTHYTDTQEAVYLLKDYTDDLANHHWINYYDSGFSVDKLWGLWEEITG